MAFLQKDTCNWRHPEHLRRPVRYLWSSHMWNIIVICETCLFICTHNSNVSRVTPLRPKSFLEAGFGPLCPPFVYFVPLSRTKPAFWISTRTALGPISQVHPGCRVRHPQYSKKLFVRIHLCEIYARVDVWYVVRACVLIVMFHTWLLHT